MNDPWTTDTRWIEEEEVRWSLTHPRGKLYIAQAGISQEIFEKNGRRASLFAQQELPNVARRQDSVHVNVGARILRVKLNPVVQDLKDTLQTMDYRERAYQIEVVLQVSHPALFAESYYRGTDPIYTVQKALQVRVKEYAERTEDRQIDKYTLRHHIESALYEQDYQSLGVILVRVVEFHLSLSTLEQDVRNIRDKSEILVIEAEGEEDVKDVHNDGDLRRRAKDEIGEIYIEKLKKKVERGTASQKDLEFLFGSSQKRTILPPISERRQLKAGRRDARDEKNEKPSPSSTDSAEPADLSRPRGRASAMYRDAWLGVSLRLHTLSDEEQTDLKLSHNTVFRVLKVNEEGQLAGYLQEGDLILKIANQPAHDIPTLRQIVEQVMDEGGDSLAIRVERDEQSYDINVDIQ